MHWQFQRNKIAQNRFRKIQYNRYGRIGFRKRLSSAKTQNASQKRLGKTFKKMQENGEDTLLINDIFADENLDEWN